MDFSAYILESLLPPNMCGDNGTAFFGSIGDEKNDLQDRTTQSALLRFPSKTHPSALEGCGIERQIERGPEESDESYATRLESGFDMWKWSGTDRGILAAMAAAGAPSHLEVLPGGSWPSDWRTPGTCWVIGNREWDPDDVPHWAKFYVIVSLHPDPILGVPYSQWYWEHLTQTWRVQIRKWKDAQATCPTLFGISSFDEWSDIWAPTGYWGDDDEGDWTSDQDGYPVWSFDIGEQ